MKTITAQQHFEKARAVMPGGVNSSARYNSALGMPFFASSAKGSRIFDLEGREFIDMCSGHGASLLGHAHPALGEALLRAIEFGYPTPFETEYHEELARRVCELVPSAERVRFCSAGSEATLHLIRVCRAFTGRKKIIRIEGHFHGYHEMIYIGGQPPPEKLADNREHPYPESPGIPEEFTQLIIPIPANDEKALMDAIERHGSEVALVILEPVNFNWAGIKTRPEYLRLLRRLTADAGIVLFFDEIQSIFKKSTGGAQFDFGVTPDVCTIGKSLGGGLPLSAFCGKAEIMELYKPFGPVQHSGTFNAHLLPVMAGLAFLDQATSPGFYPHLRRLEERFHEGMARIIADHELNMVVPNHGARFNIVFGRRTEATRYEDAFCHDRAAMLEFVRQCHARGVYVHDYGGGPIHHGYGLQHDIADIDLVLNVFEEALVAIKRDPQFVGKI